MKCLHCGHCCINYDVIILIDPDKGLDIDNVRHKPTGERCPHLLGDKPGEYRCSIHEHPIYKETPCFDFTQVGNADSPCRMGVYILNKQS